MIKLLTAYEGNPTQANAGKLVKHADKHPMSVCALTLEQLQTLKQAQTQVEKG